MLVNPSLYLEARSGPCACLDRSMSVQDEAEADAAARWNVGAVLAVTAARCSCYPDPVQVAAAGSECRLVAAP